MHDPCGTCHGDGAGCRDCLGVPGGGVVDDACGVCGGDGSSCTPAGADCNFLELMADLRDDGSLQPGGQRAACISQFGGRRPVTVRSRCDDELRCHFKDLLAAIESVGAGEAVPPSAVVTDCLAVAASIEEMQCSP